MSPAALELHLPDWIAAREQPRAITTSAERMQFVIQLAAQNVVERTGGPFAAAVFERDSGALVAVGVNLVTSLSVSILHAEVVAIVLAQRRVGSFTLSAPGLPVHELVTSCEPCAMCLGAVLWSGARRLVCGAAREDAESIGFDEGPVTEGSYSYLEQRGIEVMRGVERVAARQVLRDYAAANGVIYNG